MRKILSLTGSVRMLFINNLYFSFRYGDKAPVTYNGRLFSVVWILMGLVIIGIFNGSITTAITTFTLTFDFSLYGKTVHVCFKALFLSVFLSFNYFLLCLLINMS